MQLLAWWHFAPQLVEEVFEENNLALRLLRFGRLGRHEYDDTLAVRGEIVVRPVEAGIRRDPSNERHRGTFLKTVDTTLLHP